MLDTSKKLILVIDDDEEDFFLLKDLFKDGHADVELRWIKDGEEALAFLSHQENSPDETPKPSLILLDLNMPKLNGREVLSHIRKSKTLQCIPVIVLSNSMNKKEALDAYQLGVNSFIRKPAGYKELKEFVDILYKYWFIYSTLC